MAYEHRMKLTEDGPSYSYVNGHGQTITVYWAWRTVSPAPQFMQPAR